MKREKGYTLIEMLLVMVLTVTLTSLGSRAWQRWQQRERLWQVAVQVRDYLLLLRNDANWHRRDRLPLLQRTAAGWCLNALAQQQPPCPVSPFVLHPAWPEVLVDEITPALGFYGLRSTAWPGHITLKSRAGSRSVVVSVWGRIRLCEIDTGRAC